MRAAVLSLATAGVAALALPSAAGAVIRPQEGMAGVRIGMTQEQVREELGRPDRTRRGRNEFGPYTLLMYPNRVNITFQGNRRVTTITTTGRRERTAEDIGVRSTEAAVRDKVRGVRCKTFPGSVRSCYVGSFTPGRRVTDFRIDRGRVNRVTIGLVID